MQETEFWRIVGAAKLAAGDDIEERTETLRLELQRQPLDAIQRFQRIYESLRARAPTAGTCGARPT